MSDTRFHPRLEALRGVAALMVAYFHALALVRMDGYVPLKIKSFLNMAGNGTAGVTLFFVLSGYVLGRSLDHAAGRILPETIRFAIRRTLRIWPAMAACLAGCFFWVLLVHRPAIYEAASTDYYNYWRDGASLRDLLWDCLFQQTYFNPVTWTLQVEMIAAVLFVPAWWICRTSEVARVVLMTGWAFWFLSTPYPSRTAYMYMLLFGMHADAAARLADRYLGPRALKLCLALSFVGCCMVARWQRPTVAGTAFVESVFAYAIVALLVSSHGRAGLGAFDHRATRFMGRISYSFYLWHFPVIYVLATAGFATIDASLWLAWPNTMAGILLIVSTLVATPIAWASHRAIELSMIALAKSVTRTREG
jgi:peptidoglycan/LPS O-acetylase OafA/YrhL